MFVYPGAVQNYGAVKFRSTFHMSFWTEIFFLLQGRPFNKRSAPSLSK